MTLSFAKTGDEEILAHLQGIKNIGASVEVISTEKSEKPGTVTRSIFIEWDTHNPEARVIS